MTPLARAKRVKARTIHPLRFRCLLRSHTHSVAALCCGHKHPALIMLLITIGRELPHSKMLSFSFAITSTCFLNKKNTDLLKWWPYKRGKLCHDIVAH